MNTYFIKRFIARTAVVLSAAALFCGCSDDDETSTLHFDKPEVVIGPESSTASFILRSDTSWKLHSDADWFTLNLTKGAKSASVIITYSENTSMTEKRTAVITATTLSGDASDSFILSQMPVESYIRLETEALPISATAAHHEIGRNVYRFGHRPLGQLRGRGRRGMDRKPDPRRRKTRIRRRGERLV